MYEVGNLPDILGWGLHLSKAIIYFRGIYFLNFGGAELGLDKFFWGACLMIGNSFSKELPSTRLLLPFVGLASHRGKCVWGLAAYQAAPLAA